MKTHLLARLGLARVRSIGVLAWALACLALSGASLPAAAQPDSDPPGRVGRIADIAGPVWWFDLEQAQWTQALRNRPLTAGDRLATGRDAEAELRIGSTTIKLSDGTEVELVHLDDERVRVQLHRGSIAVRLRSREVAAETAFGTEEAWLQPQRGGLYRLDREDDTTSVASWRGELRVEGEPGLDIDAGRRLQLWREGPSRMLRHRWSAPVDDAFAASVLRDEREDERSASPAHVSPEMTGWEELDRHGRWDQHPEYGAVWTPLSMRDDWAPYRQGHWAWVRPWGWTWVDDAPWGFAPYHYGRWLSWRDRWCWVPGRYVARPVYAPALVAWIDGPAIGIGLRVGGPTLSWVPLAPWEVFRPHYRVSPGYHDRVNTPDHRRWRPPPRRGGGDHTFGNQGVPNAVTVVPSDVLRRRPPAAQIGRDDPRPRPPDADRDGRRPGNEVRIAPPPIAPLSPLPTRPQPVQPAPLQPRPVQTAPGQPPATALQPARRPVTSDSDESAARRRARLPSGETRGETTRGETRGEVAVQPAPPPRLADPLPRRTPPSAVPAGPTTQPPAVPRTAAAPPARVQPDAPAATVSRAPARDRERERERDEKKDDGKGRTPEPRGSVR